MAISLIKKLFGGRDTQADALYNALVEAARAPLFYERFQVPDTLDGRFDMLALMLSAAVVRLEADGEGTRPLRTRLREVFVDDMDETMRQIGVGDLGVGKHVKKMMVAFEGRFLVYREALLAADNALLAKLIERNVYRRDGDVISSHAVQLTETVVAQFKAWEALPTADFFTGALVA
jgi:cytochrome b pre-mRNA-processing protein 3